MTTPSPTATDEQLAAWRDAVSTAGLPEPGRTRWQVLRAGVVGLWEFDVAEYWFADGRAQFVGQNQSGKSTLMALTTLLMLAGSLDRKYVDTFGHSDKEYRYYVEPVADDRDRRDASASTNRGWTWVEYGRTGPLGPRVPHHAAVRADQARRVADDPVVGGLPRRGPGPRGPRPRRRMYTELLSSTFIDHLADRMKKVVRLLDVVNDVLRRHPTGANRTTLRLRRVPAEGQGPGFRILKALQEGSIESDSAQQQIQLFLGARLREAQDAGLVGTEDWTDRLAELLDYRTWFDVIAQYKVGDGDDETRWKDLTKKVHGVDSGGGKVVTLLQPLLATLVAVLGVLRRAAAAVVGRGLRGRRPGEPGHDDAHAHRLRPRFLLAGPAPLVAVAQVPAAAVWVITRAPAPVAGVDLSLMLWAGRTLEQVPVGDYASRVLTPRRPTEDAGPDLFTTITEPVCPPRPTGGPPCRTAEAAVGRRVR